MPSAVPAIWINTQLSITTVSWTPIVLTIAECSRLMLRNDTNFDILIRTDSADATTQETVHAGTELLIDLGSRHQIVFRTGMTVAFAQATSGTGPLIVRQIA